MTESIWDKTFPAFSRLEGDLKIDVLVIGGGMAGVLCARMLKDRGVSCTLIEADRICRGVTRNTTAKLTSQHGAVYSRLMHSFGEAIARTYWEANAAGLKQLCQLGAGIDCKLQRRDSYLYTRKVGALDEEMETLGRLGIPADFVTDLSLPISTAGAICFRDQAQFDPLRFVTGIVRDLPVYEHTPAREFVGNRVRTDRGWITAERIILATHFPILNKHGAYFMKLYQDRSYVIALENAGSLDGMYRDLDSKGFSFREADGQVLLGGGSHRTGKKSGGWEMLETRAREFYPHSRVTHRWATQDCVSLDGIPYIGQYSPKTPNLFVATGFNKWGMTSSMVAATILSDLVCDRENPWAAVFSPCRSIWRKQLFLNAGESVMNLLRPTAPRCPHMGCALRWNDQERSWDCPCHGSRFDGEGKLLDNPATGDL